MARPGGSCHDAGVPQDRVTDWQDELLRIAPRLLELPPAARQAVFEAVFDFWREDAEGAPALAA